MRSVPNGSETEQDGTNKTMPAKTLQHRALNILCHFAFKYYKIVLLLIEVLYYTMDKTIYVLRI